MVEVPDSLPARMFLLAYDVTKKRMTARSRLGYVLRGAALTELYLDGRLGEKNGKPCVETAGDDPYGLLHQISGSRPRSWQHWVRKDHRAIVRAVQAELAREGWIRVEQHRVLGLFPATRVTVRDTRVVKALWGGASSALRGTPVAHVNSWDAAAVALAAAGDLKAVLPRSDRRRYKRRIEELTARSGPAAKAVRKAVDAQNAASGAAG
ncbi:GPP34 family phosphoprotein [Spirillospora sp. NPDC048911]|uniref:GOLPH3/VPS74 family protein n=1 Tax=Spirillospora sp. NPDC048911 TaxID=3364527 RepID=UPI0037216B5A